MILIKTSRIIAAAGQSMGVSRFTPENLLQLHRF